MKYLDEYRDKEQVRILVDAIHRKVTRPWNIMEICGGQTHAIARYHIEEMLPRQVKLFHGPGCPVCVTPVEIIDHALEIARNKNVIFSSFGDMMRVPGTKADLLKIKAEGADIRILYSPLDALDIAAKNPDREIVFFAIGFETTVPVHLTAVKEAARRGLDNFSILTSFFTVPPAIDSILSDPQTRLDGFLTAGHVCAVTGNEAYHMLARKYSTPMVVTGFEPVDLLYGIYRCILQLEEGEAYAENAYKRVVPENGNPVFTGLMDEMLDPVDQEWRGIGTIRGSGLRLNAKYKEYDAACKFSSVTVSQAIVDNSSACIAGDIMRGIRQVTDCCYFGEGCTPDHPVGAPMVSTEGVCAAYYNYK